MRHIIGMRGCGLTLAITFILCIMTGVTAYLPSYKCDGTPEMTYVPRRLFDNRYMIRISGNPLMYVPGEKYAVGIQGTRQLLVPEKFVGFALTVESSISSAEREPSNVGTFQLFGDALTKFSEKCPHMVVQASGAARSEVNVHWTAPPAGSGCVIFRATIVEDRDLWYMHDGLLSRTMCEDVQENLDEQPDVLERCCACDEAKYEVTFEGLWSRHTHPKDFPPNSWLTKFSDVIGASHTVNYRFWNYGGIASEGLREVAERGSTRMLESELKAESENIRTIIKARGIAYPNVTGKTFAVFRVDKQHHLMSLVSMIVPSPDWIVGVSGLELCLRNCSWVEFKVLNLKPWDVGTDSGLTYTSPDSPTTPRDPIRRITSKFPADDSNPFYDPSGEDMKPLARLYLTRQRLYEKSCSDDSIGTDDEDPSQPDCAVGEWKPWSMCSVTCGLGFRHRERSYVRKYRPECNRKLRMQEPCLEPPCSGDSYWPTDLNAPSSILNDPRCAVGEWEEWSSCTKTCGNGVKTRSRCYLMQGAQKLCGGRHGAPDLQQTVPCGLEKCEGEEETQQNEKCPPRWTEWTACSTTCGRGIKTRSTFPLDGECPYEPMTEKVECELRTCNFTAENVPEMCLQPLAVGECKNRYERWYFDSQTVTCKGFYYWGCKGNANNFLTKEDCMNACSALVKELRLNRTRQMAKYGVKVSAVLAYHIPLANEFGTASPDCDLMQPKPKCHPDFKGFETGSHVIDPPDAPSTPGTLGTSIPWFAPIDCKVSLWSHWSPCSSSCGNGIKIKTRHIEVHPKNGGKPCPEKLESVRACGKRNNCGGNHRESGEIHPTWGEAAPPGSASSGTSLWDCVMGKWSPWSPCSATCGLQASQMRTRKVLGPSLTGQPCGERVQIRSCNLLSCKA